MTKCMTEEGHAVTVGDVVWGKIHGFPWWPARCSVLAVFVKKTARSMLLGPKLKSPGSVLPPPPNSRLPNSRRSANSSGHASTAKRKGCTGVPSWRLPRRWDTWVLKSQLYWLTAKLRWVSCLSLGEMTSKAYFSFDVQQNAFKVLRALDPCALESLIFAK